MVEKGLPERKDHETVRISRLMRRKSDLLDGRNSLDSSEMLQARSPGIYIGYTLVKYDGDGGCAARHSVLRHLLEMVCQRSPNGMPVETPRPARRRANNGSQT